MALLRVSLKSSELLETYWTADSGVDYYKVYVSKVDATAAYAVVKTNIANQPSSEVQYKGKIHTRITIAEVRTALSDATLVFDGSTVYYFRITTVSGGVETAVASSATKQVFPEGITDQKGVDNEATNAQNYGFSFELQRWTRSAGTKFGATNTFENTLYADNLTVDKTYTTVSATNVVATELWYFTGTPTGGRAKLVTYTYSGIALPSKVVWSDSVVP